MSGVEERVKEFLDNFWRIKERAMREYKLTISPSIPPEERYELEKTIKLLGYKILGSGTCMDMSSCDIAFQGKDDEKQVDRILWSFLKKLPTIGV